MTELGPVHGCCPECKMEVTFVGYRTIHPGSLGKYLDSVPEVECPNCHELVPIGYTTLVVGKGRMYPLDLGASPGEKRRALEEWGIIDETGQIPSPRSLRDW